ncbi:MAG: hypothetical protein C0622_05795, partial [Desulfuromonas sp.]
MQQLRLVGVSFHGAGKIFDFDALELELAPGDKVIVETERGRALGTVITAPRTISPDEAPPKLKAVVRQASESDLELAAANEARGQEALKFCQQRVNERKMEMKLVRAEYLYDGSKIIFYFTADGRVDFRDLVRDLAQHFRTRIEMRQIGVRDEAKMVGGLGICGRELCCSNHLREFAPVSVKMAKAQGLALNPTKISGQCGRLLCCLAYEYETYSELIKALPKCGKKLQLSKCQAEVVALDILAQKVTLSKADGERIVLGVDELRDEMAGKPAQSEPADTSKSAEENAQATSTDSADNSDNDQKKQVRRNDRRK